MKEAAYDEHIAPLMTQIIELCQKHNINMAATFALDKNDECDPLFCTTILPVDEEDEPGMKRIRECERVMYPRPEFTAFTIRRG